MARCLGLPGRASLRTDRRKHPLCILPVWDHLLRNRQTGKSKGFCFISYEDQRSTILAVDNCKGIKFKGRTVSESTRYPATAPFRLQGTWMTPPENSRRRSVGFRPPHPVHLKAPTTKHSPNNVNKKSGKEYQGEDCCLS